MLELAFSPARAPRNGWRRSVREARVAIEGILDRKPSVRPTFPGVVADERAGSAGLALGDLDDHRETDGARRTALADRRYDVDAEGLSDWLPESAQGRSDA